MSRPRLLDLFSGAGGCARGYQLAGFHVTGVDIRPQPRYAGDVFIQADALTFPLEGFDAIHASPPCQAFSSMTRIHGREHADLLTPILRRLETMNVPWAIENVAGAPVPNPLILCGTMFGLGAICRNGEYRELRRHRLFGSNYLLMAPGACKHRHRGLGVYGGGCSPPNSRHYQGTVDEKRAALETPWAGYYDVSQMIPPAFTRWIGSELLAALGVELAG